jgi:hypothetical protein
MLSFGELIVFVRNVKKGYFAGYVWYVEFVEAYWITDRW